MSRFDGCGPDRPDLPDNVISFTDAATLAGYLRSSWNNESRIEAQRQQIEAWAVENGFRIVEFVDNAVRGDLPLEKRPGLLRAVTAIEDGVLAGLVVDIPDRLSRHTELVEYIRHRVWRGNGRNYTVMLGETFRDEGSLEIRNFRRQLAQADENELWAIRVRRQRGRDRKRARQGYLGGRQFARPYGRELVEDLSMEGRRDYRPVPEEQDVIRRMIAWYREGVAYCEIARRLNAEGIPTVTGVPWVHKVVRDLVKRGPTGIGAVPSTSASVRAERPAKTARQRSA